MLRLNNIYSLVVALFVVLFFTQCDKGDIYSSFVSYQGAVWEKDQMAQFDVKIDEEGAYDTDIIIRNNNDYPFQNLWLFVDIKSPDGEMTKDSLNIELADIYGKWYGKGINIFEYVYPYKQALLFPDTGTYIFTVRQGMRAESLIGISDLGVRIRTEN